MKDGKRETKEERVSLRICVCCFNKHSEELSI